MRTLQVDVTVSSEGTVTIPVSPEIEPGSKVGVFLVVRDTPNSQSAEPLDLPAHDFGPWPDGLSLRREDMYASDAR